MSPSHTDPAYQREHGVCRLRCNLCEAKTNEEVSP